MFIERDGVNIERLDEQLRAALGDALVGVSVVSEGLMLHLTRALDPDQAANVRRIVREHDPNSLSAVQAQTRARQQKLAAARAAISAELDIALLGAADPSVLVLARYVAWLEQEIRDLRRGG